MPRFHLPRDRHQRIAHLAAGRAPARRSGSLGRVVALGAALVLAAASGVLAEGSERWRMPLAAASQSPQAQAARSFAALVGEKTAGRLLIETYPSGALFAGDRIEPAARAGEVELGAHPLAAMAELSALGRLDALFFVASDIDAAWRLYQAQRPALEAKLDALGLALLYAGPRGAIGLATKAPLAGAADFAALTIAATATEPLAAALELGARRLAVDEPQLAAAFALGQAEAVFIEAALVRDRGLSARLRYFYDMRLAWPKTAAFANKAALDALAPEDRAAVLAAAAEVETQLWAIAEARVAADLDGLRAAGVAVGPAPADAARAIARAAEIRLEAWLAEADEGALTALTEIYPLSRALESKPADAPQPTPAQEPEAAVAEPVAIAAEPAPAAEEPAAAVVEPAPAAVEPAPAVVEPAAAVVEPAPAVVEPAAAVVEPAPAVVEPAAAVVEPAAAVVEPAATPAPAPQIVEVAPAAPAPEAAPAASPAAPVEATDPGASGGSAAPEAQ